MDTKPDKPHIYALELHEGYEEDGGLYIVRVASGWIYYYGWDSTKHYFTLATFVPFDNRFDSFAVNPFDKPKQ